jgi:hypothetical protein
MGWAEKEVRGDEIEEIRKDRPSREGMAARRRPLTVRVGAVGLRSRGGRTRALNATLAATGELNIAENGHACRAGSAQIRFVTGKYRVADFLASLCLDQIFRSLIMSSTKAVQTFGKKKVPCPTI